MFTIEWTDEAKKQLKKLPHGIGKRIYDKVGELKENTHALTKLVGLPFYRLRVGDYRVLVDVQHGKMIILILEVGHRRNVYD